MSVRRYLIAPLVVLAACSTQNQDGDSSSSAASTTTLTPGVGTDVANGPAQTQQQDVVVVAGGGQYLTAWTEAPGPNSHIMAERVDATGALVDARSIALPRSASGNDINPAIAWNGTSYLLVWEHVGAAGSNVLGARVGTDGKVIDTTPWTITSAKAGLPSVAWNGSEYLVTWSDQRSGVADVYGIRYSATGTVSGAEIRISTSGGTSGKPSSVSANGASFLVAWDEGGNGVFGARVNAGAVVDTDAIKISTSSDHNYAPSIASNGSNWLVSWFEYDGAATLAVNALRISADGTKLDASPISLATSGGGHPAASWDGEAYAIAWKNGARRVGADGQLGSTFNFRSGSNDTRPGIAGIGSNVFIASGADGHGLLQGQLSTQAMGAIYAKTGINPTKDAVALSRDAAAQRGVAAASDGTNWLAIWQEYRTDWEHPELWGAVYKGSGTLLSSPGFKLRDGATAPSLPSVVYDGTKYLVGWEEGGINAIQNVNKDGSLVGVPAFSNNGNPGRVLQIGSKSILVVDGKGYLVTNGVSDLSHTIFDRGDDPGFSVATTPLAVWTGNSLTVVWGAYKGTAFEIHSVRFSPQLQKLDAAPVRLTGFTMGSRMPVIAAAGDGHGRTLVAWEDVTAGAIMGMRLTDPTPVRIDGAGGGLHSYAPSILWDGAAWVIAYETRASLQPDPTGSGIFFTTWAPPAALGAATSVATSNGAGPLVSPGSGGATFIAYESSNAGSSRITMRSFTDTSTPPSSSSSSSSGGTSGTVTPGDDDDSTGPPGPPSGDDDDDNKQAGSNPKKPEPKPELPVAPTKKKDDTGAAPPKAGGCNSSGSSTDGASWLLVALGALLVRRRRDA
jgi:MYXO-CTERM domain-containing protein